MKVVKINESNIFTLLARGSIVLTIVLTVGSLFLGSLKFSYSVLVGGLLAIANFYWLRSILQRTLQLQPDRAPRFAVLRYIVRLALLGIAIFFLLTYVGVDIFGLILGLSVLVINIIVLSIYMYTLKGG